MQIQAQPLLNIAKVPEDDQPTETQNLSAADLSLQVLNLIPRSMGALRTKFRQHHHDSVSANLSEKLTVAQFRVLFQLRKGGNTNARLADVIGISPAAMSRLITGMIGKGLLQREATASDRREYHLQLTLEGRKLTDRVRANSMAELTKRIAPLSAAEKQKLKEGCEIIGQLFGI